tara:strand:+ start:239 stop:478 length:240 start_codon:yes stop_codon:yes gene_type:complete
MKSPLLHFFGKHPAEDGHVRSDHKERRAEKKAVKKKNKAAKKATRDTEFEKKYGVHPKNTRRYMDGTLINLITNEAINE